MKKYLSIIVLFVFISCTSKIKVERCIDGDTIVSATGERIRLCEIDASELHQFYGIQAKTYLESLIEGKTIEIRRKGKDKYKRTLAELYYNGIWINERMVLSGNAWSYKDQLISDQEYAQKLHLGMWRYKNNLEPYKFRRNERRN